MTPATCCPIHMDQRVPCHICAANPQVELTIHEAVERGKGHALLPTDAKARKNVPIARGVLDYFPKAIAAVAELSRIGNDQHNPGQPMHWSREKSTDNADCIVRHLIERGTVDTDGVRHSTKVAWRALALLQLELEAAELTAKD